MNTRFTIEELNLISIYIYDDRSSLIEEIIDALPYTDEDMRELADRTLYAFASMTIRTGDRNDTHNAEKYTQNKTDRARKLYRCRALSVL